MIGSDPGRSVTITAHGLALGRNVKIAICDRVVIGGVILFFVVAPGPDAIIRAIADLVIPVRGIQRRAREFVAPLKRIATGDITRGGET